MELVPTAHLIHDESHRRHEDDLRDAKREQEGTDLLLGKVLRHQQDALHVDLLRQYIVIYGSIKLGKYMAHHINGI